MHLTCPQGNSMPHQLTFKLYNAGSALLQRQPLVISYSQMAREDVARASNLQILTHLKEII